MRSILKAIGEDCLWRGKVEIVESQCASQDNGVFNAFRLRLPVGNEGCTVKDNTWVPEGLRKMLPENIGTFGAPWMHCVPGGTFLDGPEEFPYVGFGQLLIGMGGAFGLVSWPGKYATDIAMSPNKTFGNVGRFGDGSPTQF